MRSGRSERLLRGIDHVQEAVLVPLALIHLGNGRRDGDHAVAVDQQEEGLVRVQLQAPPGGQTQNNIKKKNNPASCEKNRNESNFQPPSLRLVPSTDRKTTTDKSSMLLLYYYCITLNTNIMLILKSHLTLVLNSKKSEQKFLLVLS